eukprot:scaffold2601_cov198-Pinguiococcus_pyrenoidosus.AAC.4
MVKLLVIYPIGDVVEHTFPSFSMDPKADALDADVCAEVVEDGVPEEFKFVDKFYDEDKDLSYFVYGNLEGEAGTENKYEFPPPLDTTLFFGSVVIVGFSEQDESFVSISSPAWDDLCIDLVQGFANTAEDDSEEEESDVEEPEDEEEDEEEY